MGGVDLEKIVDAKVMVTPSCAKKATTKKRITSPTLYASKTLVAPKEEPFV